MTEEAPGATVETQIVLLLPLPDGRWRYVQGTMWFVNGLHHKIAFPGFETRSGEGFGITVTYHVPQNLRDHGAGRLTGDVVQMVIVNGAMARANEVAKEAEIVGYPIASDP